jgi:hypothetical protein
MSAQDSEQTEDDQDAKSSDEHDDDTDGEARDSDDEHDGGGDDDDDGKYTGEHGEDMSEIGQVSKEKVSDEPSEEGKEEVKKIAEAYADKKTAVMPGTDRTITGTAVNQWLDDDGNPKFGDPDEHPFAKDDDDDDEHDGEDHDSKDHDGEDHADEDRDDKDHDGSTDSSEDSKESADHD